MRLHIVFPFTDGPYGGGNQFLKALREQFRKVGSYAETPKEADIFLINSFQDIRLALQMKQAFPDVPFVHRVDGPISLYRNSRSASIDRFIFSLNEAIADATVFQSRFSMTENKILGMLDGRPEVTIFNAPDPEIFFPKTDMMEVKGNRKTRLISNSWSSNIMKGFDTYEYLDSHLDFSKFEYDFIGNSPVMFKNIRVIPPQPSGKIAALLRSADMYITASRKDPCSNSLIEALSCGLPAIALDDGGHPELLGAGGELFTDPGEIPEKIEKILTHRESYLRGLPTFSIEEKAFEYMVFFQNILEKKDAGALVPKRIMPLRHFSLSIRSLLSRI
jgi:glycosyltransferase involved in cell wall biosynthesis